MNGPLPDSFQTTGNTKTIKETSNGFIEVSTYLRVGDAGDGRVKNVSIAEDSESFSMAVRSGR